jgi:hypothetical protein
MKQLVYYRLSQAANYEQARADNATVTVSIDTSAHRFGEMNGELNRIMDIITKTVNMMDGNEKIAWRLLGDLGDRGVLLDTLNEPEIELTDDEEAFAKAYDHNVAIHDGRTVRDFLRRDRSGDWDYIDEGFPSAMMDSWSMWCAAKESVKMRLVCPQCGCMFSL